MSKKIIRSMNYFNRYFPKMVELTSYEDFAHNNDPESIKNFELGGVFVLDKPNIEFMLKFSIRPDFSMII
jgi:hypothetical protein